MRIVALIPARAGSRRIPGKNTKLLGGKPLIQWTIEAAQQSGVFERIIVSSDECLCRFGGAGITVIHRPPELATDSSPDIEWVKNALNVFGCDAFDAFAILRPTSPFRSANAIRDAWQYFQHHQPADSLRAVRFVREPPQKMWVLALGGRMVPLLPFHHPRIASGPPVPWHSSPTQSLPQFVVQTSALEIAWTRTVTLQQSISGTSVLSYFMDEAEDIDINDPEDWARAEQMVAALQAPPAA